MKMLEEIGLFQIRNTFAIAGCGERVTDLCMKNSLSESPTALFEDASFRHYFNYLLIPRGKGLYVEEYIWCR